MYSFYSPDIDKTIYVSRFTNVYYSGGYSSYFVPLEQMYMAFDIIDYFADEINNSMASHEDFHSNTIKLFKYINNGQLSSSYYCVAIAVVHYSTYTQFRLYKGYTTGSRPSNYSSWNDFTGLNWARRAQYGTGKIYVAQFLGRDWRAETTPGFNGLAGPDVSLSSPEACVGTYAPPSSTYPKGRVSYSFTDMYVDWKDALICQESALGCDTVEGYANETETVYYGGGFSSSSALPSSGASYACSFDGSYDPDSPGPPWDPSDGDPNIDGNNEPIDNPWPHPGPKTRDYDTIPIPPVPGVTATGAGFTTLYRPSESMLRLLASEMYSDNVLQQLVNYFTSMQDMIAGLSIVPFIVPVSGRAKHRIGLWTSDVALDVVSSQFVDVDCGTIQIEHYFSGFLDYSPYTRLILWLPYIGYQEIPVDEVMGSYVRILYRCDCLSGACIAYVITGVSGESGINVPRVIAQFTGNCIVQVPTAAASYDTMISAGINILTTMASAGISQGVAAASMAAAEAGGAGQEDLDAMHANAAGNAGKGLLGAAADVVTGMKPSVIRNGTPGSTAGYMGVQKPYLIKLVPRESLPDNYITQRGYPSNRKGPLGDPANSGYVEVDDIQLNNVPATINEINEIYMLLKGGVIL